jgi:ribosomal protein L37AE/L43A
MAKIPTPMHIYICPVCGSKNTNKISLRNFYCVDCCVEFSDKGDVYIIEYDGELTDYYEYESYIPVN